MIPQGAPKLDEILIQSESVPWREKSLRGVHGKMLWRNDATGASIGLIKFDKGAGIPQPHYHASNQFMFLPRGAIRIHRDRGRAHPWMLLLQSQRQRARAGDRARGDGGGRDLRRPALPGEAALVHRRARRAVISRSCFIPGPSYAGLTRV